MPSAPVPSTKPWGAAVCWACPPNLHCCTQFKMPWTGTTSAFFAMAAAGSAEWRLLVPPAGWKVWRTVDHGNDFTVPTIY